VTRYADTRIYGVTEIRELLRAVDRHLPIHASIVIIGGAAAAFYEAESTTTDIDTFEAIGAELEDAVAHARVETGLGLVLGHSAVADVPYNFEDRLVRELPELTRLTVRILEKHDLALSKCVRGNEHDLQQLEEIHARGGLSLEILVERFRTEMSHVMGDPARIRTNFLELIERLFGELARARLAR